MAEPAHHPRRVPVVDASLPAVSSVSPCAPSSPPSCSRSPHLPGRKCGLPRVRDSVAAPFPVPRPGGLEGRSSESHSPAATLVAAASIVVAHPGLSFALFPFEARFAMPFACCSTPFARFLRFLLFFGVLVPARSMSVRAWSSARLRLVGTALPPPAQLANAAPIVHAAVAHGSVVVVVGSVLVVVGRVLVVVGRVLVVVGRTGVSRMVWYRG
jgi:hypothetical protein